MTPEQAFFEIRRGLNMEPEGATPEEVVRQVRKLYEAYLHAARSARFERAGWQQLGQ